MSLPPQPPIAQDDHENPVAGIFVPGGPNPGITSAPGIGYFTYTSADGQVVTLSYPQQTGPTVKFVNFPNTVITPGTPVSMYTPSAGKRFRVVSYHLSLDAVGAVIMEDGPGGIGQEFIRTPQLPASSGQPSPNMGAGYPSTTVGNHLFIDIQLATGATAQKVSGWIAVSEEV